jgi:hypothetical protein
MPFRNLCRVDLRIHEARVVFLETGRGALGRMRK